MVQYHIIIFLAIFGESPQNSFGQKNIWYSSRSSTYWILEISHWTWWIFPLFISQHIISILWYKKYIDVNTYTESKAHTIFCSTLLCYVDHRGAPKLLVLTPADDFLTHQTMSVWYPSFFQRPQGKHPRWLENHQYIYINHNLYLILIYIYMYIYIILWYGGFPFMRVPLVIIHFGDFTWNQPAIGDPSHEEVWCPVTTSSPWWERLRLGMDPGRFSPGLQLWKGWTSQPYILLWRRRI